MKVKSRSGLELNGPGIFIIGLHLTGIIALFFYLSSVTPSVVLLFVSIVFLYLTLFGITAGYHRLYAHPTYRAKTGAELILLLLATAALQGSALRWSSDHRLHHAHTDQEKDPYSVAKGFWYAHVLWIYTPPYPLQHRLLTDLLRQPLVVWQHKYYFVLALATNLLPISIIGLVTGEWLGALLFVGIWRLIFSYHITWFINSLAHYWGERSYAKELSARDNAILALMTVGEGYHNFHHTFPGDYRNGVKWYHFDPGKWLIWSLHKLGLASRPHSYSTDRIFHKLVTLDHKSLLQNLAACQTEELKRILTLTAQKTKDALEEKVKFLAHALQQRQAEMNRLISHRRRLADKTQLTHIRQQLKSVRSEFRVYWQEWSRLCTLILKPKMIS